MKRSLSWVVAILLALAFAGQQPAALGSMAEKTPRAQYTSTGGTAYTFAWPIWLKTDLQVRKGAVPQVVDRDYVVTFTAGAAAGGTVTFLAAPTVGTVVTIERQTPRARATDFGLFGALSMGALNAQLDKLTAQVQDTAARVDRALVQPLQVTQLPVMPEPVANMLLGYNSEGQVTHYSSVAVGGVPTLTDYSTTLRVADIITRGPWVDVRAYGAVADGTTTGGTDLGAAVQAAVDALPATGGVIFIPPGVYWQSTAVLVEASHVAIYAEPGTVTIISGLPFVGHSKRGAVVDTGDPTTWNWLYKFKGTATALTTLNANTFARGEKSIVVTDATGIALGDVLSVEFRTYDAANMGRVIAISGTTITLDRPCSNTTDANAVVFKVSPIVGCYFGGPAIDFNGSGVTRLTGTAVYDPPSLAAGATATTTVTVTGAPVGEWTGHASFVQTAVAPSYDYLYNLPLPNVTILATDPVATADTVTMTLTNTSAGTVDLAEALITAEVEVDNSRYGYGVMLEWADSALVEKIEAKNVGSMVVIASNSMDSTVRDISCDVATAPEMDGGHGYVVRFAVSTDCTARNIVGRYVRHVVDISGASRNRVYDSKGYASVSTDFGTHANFCKDNSFYNCESHYSSVGAYVFHPVHGDQYNSVFGGVIYSTPIVYAAQDRTNRFVGIRYVGGSAIALAKGGDILLEECNLLLGSADLLYGKQTQDLRFSMKGGSLICASTGGLGTFPPDAHGVPGISYFDAYDMDLGIVRDGKVTAEIVLDGVTIVSETLSEIYRGEQGRTTLRLNNCEVRGTALADSQTKTLTATDVATDTLTVVGHGWADGTRVYLKEMRDAVLPSALTARTEYFVLSTGADTIKLEASVGGGAIDFAGTLPNYGSVTIARPSATVTAANATDTFTSVGHGFADNTVVYIRSAGGLVPAGLSVRTPYYVVGRTADTFQLSASSGGAAINITDDGTGTLNVYIKPVAPLFIDGDMEAYNSTFTYDDIGPGPFGYYESDTAAYIKMRNCRLTNCDAGMFYPYSGGSGGVYPSLYIGHNEYLNSKTPSAAFTAATKVLASTFGEVANLGYVAIPAAGTFTEGCLIANEDLDVGDPLGWACVSTGTASATTLKGFGEIRSTLTGSATYDPASLADAAGATTTVTVTGAALGDRATATFSLDLQGITLTAWVSSANTVSARFQNESGGTLDLASGTLRVSVEQN